MRAGAHNSAYKRDPVRLESVPGLSACQKLFDKPGGRGSKLPRHSHPHQFLLKSFRFPGAKTARKRFLLWKMEFSAAKSPRAHRTRRWARPEVREGFGPLELSWSFRRFGARFALQAYRAPLRRATGSPHSASSCPHCHLCRPRGPGWCIAIYHNRPDSRARRSTGPARCVCRARLAFRRDHR